ncbi:cysteine peptidase family C39 domain-containing protein [Hallella colorans]|uniref:cysteine peptidase family C39 domain-containing protein n=1 Tax=Hallella colorans TaxID=1703337 RepID=UPI0023F1C133|nr:cysteine peptidase family C39 domain-containing protein [Hallella colorans]
MGSFPLIRQHDSMECGITCLAMVRKFFRMKYSIEYLSRICYATTEGVSLLGINETALQLAVTYGKIR